MSNYISCVFEISLLSVAVTQAGCGPAAGRVAVHPVSGVVLVNGSQVSGVELQFHPLTEMTVSHAIFPRAITGDQGRFELSTYRPGDGVPEGEYAVTASWRLVSTSDPEELHPDEVSAVAERLATRFTDPETTPLRVSVTRGSNELAAFNLELAD